MSHLIMDMRTNKKKKKKKIAHLMSNEEGVFWIRKVLCLFYIIKTSL